MRDHTFDHERAAAEGRLFRGEATAPRNGPTIPEVEALQRVGARSAGTPPETTADAEKLKAILSIIEDVFGWDLFADAPGDPIKAFEDEMRMWDQQYRAMSDELRERSERQKDVQAAAPSVAQPFSSLEEIEDEDWERPSDFNIARLLATARKAHRRDKTAQMAYDLGFEDGTKQGAADTARLDALFELLPFAVRHRFGGDLQEFRAGIDAARGSTKRSGLPHDSEKT